MELSGTILAGDDYEPVEGRVVAGEYRAREFHTCLSDGLGENRPVLGMCATEKNGLSVPDRPPEWAVVPANQSQ